MTKTQCQFLCVLFVLLINKNLCMSSAVLSENEQVLTDKILHNDSRSDS